MHWLLGLDYHHWLLAGLVILVLELVVRQWLLFWTGMAAALTGLLVLLLPLAGVHLAWGAQIAVFVGFALIFPVLRGINVLLATGEQPRVGEEYQLESDLKNRRGYILFNDRRWPVSGPDLPAGTRVRISARALLTFEVEPTE